ncbi:hypothetical protein F5Y19DRAFT_482736 [Xylariaceae sp. FL1651]|nr:hypothetical protein F5Y19DRAFT_482736 [Xylariaceae sp. FL1651]
MVFLPPYISRGLKRLNAYILPSFPESELLSLKRALECDNDLGIELLIQRAPAEYADKTPEYIRARENEAGRFESFILIDSRAAGCLSGFVWYVQFFATEEDVAKGLAELTQVVWRIPFPTSMLPGAMVQYETANMSLIEDLELWVKKADFPVGVNYNVVFPEIDRRCAEPAISLEEHRRKGPVEVVAYPGEFEESTDEELCKSFPGVPARIARLKKGIAEGAGLQNAWATPIPVREIKIARSHVKFPEGCVKLHLKFDPDSDFSVVYRQPPRPGRYFEYLL